MISRDRTHPHPDAPLEREGVRPSRGNPDAVKSTPPKGEGTGGGEAGCVLTENASLLGRNTLRVDANAAWLAEIHSDAAIPSLFAQPVLKDRPRLLLGEGSNVLFVADYPGVIVTMKTHGIEVVAEDADAVHVRIAAGEHWDAVVRWTLAHGYPGLENLILIPGSAGAAPMQNIGAYGVEVGEFIQQVDAWDPAAGRFIQFANDACGFGYRDSVFKRNPDRWLITAVTLRVPRAGAPRTDYAGLREELVRMGIGKPAPIHVAEAVVALRTRKLPDPAVIGNAGSFFKNPAVPADIARALQRDHPGLAHWPTSGGGAKLSAAWLIDSCGFKGIRDGDAGVSNRHALVLVNHGHATGAQLWALAQRVRDGVADRFGITLEPEPRIIGLS